MYSQLDNELHRIISMSICIHINDNLVPERYILDTQELFLNVKRKDLVYFLCHQAGLYHYSYSIAPVFSHFFTSQL